VDETRCSRKGGTLWRASERMRSHLVDQQESGCEPEKREDPAETETEHENTREVESVQGFSFVGSNA